MVIALIAIIVGLLAYAHDSRQARTFEQQLSDLEASHRDAIYGAKEK